jgi:spermidine synthase
MSSWELLDSATIPNNGGELHLFKRNEEFLIKISGKQGDLMSSHTHGSEDALGELACRPFANRKSARILVGGLGMGFTLAAALKSLAADAEVTVAELVPGVVEWNQNLIGECAGHPLADKRVKIRNADVGPLINNTSASYDAILLDVDNGPEGLTHQENNNLYSIDGLQAAYSALRKSGVLAVWSASPSKKFVTLLKKVGFSVDERKVRAHQGKGARRVIWLATKGK